mmetsp:Transcript_13670/g.31213  ORF Transcript_13670/g.31213 Transcript_13670/m.31213 type:complete len:280 (+) Transcript_13670:377-1216(+)
MGCLAMYSMAPWTDAILSASSSGISRLNSSSKAMTTSTVSSESRPRSLVNSQLSAVTLPGSTLSMFFTTSSTRAVTSSLERPAASPNAREGIPKAASEAGAATPIRPRTACATPLAKPFNIKAMLPFLPCLSRRRDATDSTFSSIFICCQVIAISCAGLGPGDTHSAGKADDAVLAALLRRRLRAAARGADELPHAAEAGWDAGAPEWPGGNELWQRHWCRVLRHEDVSAAQAGNGGAAPPAGHAVARRRRGGASVRRSGPRSRREWREERERWWQQEG